MKHRVQVGHEPLRFSGRVVAATHRPLEDAQARGTFREDLFYRLAAGVVRVPPLRDRRTDIPGLARHLLARAAAELSLKEPPSLAPDAVDELCARAWAGNVRELENALRLGLALSLARSEGVLRLADLRAGGPRRPLEPALSVAPPVDADGGIDPSLDLAAATERFQQARVRAALEANGGNRSAAARQLGVSRQWLHRLLSRWDDADAEGGQ